MSDEFLSPDQLLQDFSQKVPSFKQKNVQPDWMRSQWTAGHLGKALETVGLEVRARIVGPGEEADFELALGQSKLRFQHTEATHPETKPGKEYSSRLKNPMHLTKYEPQRGMFEGPNWIGAAVGQKAAKNYSTPLHLIVYASFDADDLDLERVRTACDPYRQRFLSVWVIQDHRVVQLFESGQLRYIARNWVYFQPSA